MIKMLRLPSHDDDDSQDGADVDENDDEYGGDGDNDNVDDDDGDDDDVDGYRAQMAAGDTHPMGPTRHLNGKISNFIK